MQLLVDEQPTFICHFPFADVLELPGESNEFRVSVVMADLLQTKTISTKKASLSGFSLLLRYVRTGQDFDQSVFSSPDERPLPGNPSPRICTSMRAVQVTCEREWHLRWTPETYTSQRFHIIDTIGFELLESINCAWLL